RSHVSADAVTHDGQPFGIDAYFSAVLGYPFGSGVDFIDRSRVMRFGRRCVVHENGGKAAVGYEVAHESLMRREVTENPTAAMHKDKSRQDGFGSRRADDGEVHLQSVL